MTIFSVPSLPIATDDLAVAVTAQFGFSGAYSPLTGERDLNFLLQTDNAKYVVKVSHQDEKYAALEFQSLAISEILARDPGMPIPHEYSDRSGLKINTMQFAGGPARLVRVIRFIDGVSLSAVPRNGETRRQVGALAARLSLALHEFKHAADDYSMLWDIQRVDDLADQIAGLPMGQRVLVDLFYERYRWRIAPIFTQFRRQVVHNDLNLHNLMVAADCPTRIVGCIDFGDMVRTALVFDLAVAAAYQVDSENDPLGSIIDMARAYHQVLPLNNLEIEHLVTLVAMRCVLTVAITAWRAKLHPHNAAYILRNQPRALAVLAALAAIPEPMARDRLRTTLAGV
jgi:hydroxylysine kinase